ncbi:ParB/RepB/Spo0J family partition protein [uncultured Reyranella sp.]|uniref:ParB/RepB/Spo0J family partition protein n=1 Tax=uncultured Reyranella sp. TaxID=735512 RepID=UPI00259CB3B6|nr:ParB/RepB/Spo0J family partition protein [uncultured Reyranella sp.]
MVNTFKSPLQKAVVGWLSANPGISITELGRRADIDRGDLGKINSGQKHSLNMESAARLAQAMGTTVEGLLTGEASAPQTTGAATTGPDLGARMIPLADIDPSPDNPRKDFDEEQLAQLAASIAAQGLLQPIVVRAKGARFEIVAGERRYRALKLNNATEALCLVREGDDEATTRALSIIENLQRADIKPVEEADAFLALAQLDPKKWNATTIGKAIGMSDRFVAQRLSIARNLAPALKEKLAAGELKIESARVLAGWPQTLQGKVDLFDWMDATHIRQRLRAMVVPVARRAFDLKLYTGEIVEQDGEKFFADKDAFKRLQDEAAARLAVSLSKDWPGARFVEMRALRDYRWADDGLGIYLWEDKREADGLHEGLVREDVTAVVFVNDSDDEVIALKGVVPHETLAAKVGDLGGSGRDELAREEQQHKQVGAAIDEVRGKLLEDMPAHAALAQRLFVYAAVGRLGHELYVETDPDDYLEPWRAQLEGILEITEHGWEPYESPKDGEDRLWVWLTKQDPGQIEQMFCRLMAVQIAPVRYRSPEAPQLAAYKALGIELPEVLQQLYADEAATEDDEEPDLGGFEPAGEQLGEDVDQAEAA